MFCSFRLGSCSRFISLFFVVFMTFSICLKFPSRMKKISACLSDQVKTVKCSKLRVRNNFELLTQKKYRYLFYLSYAPIALLNVCFTIIQSDELPLVKILKKENDSSIVFLPMFGIVGSRGFVYNVGRFCRMSIVHQKSHLYHTHRFDPNATQLSQQ